jgi:hypothetical protein
MRTSCSGRRRGCWGGVEVTGHDDRQRTIQGRVGGQVDQGLRLGDAVVVVGGLILQARRDDLQGAGGVGQGRDHGDRGERSAPGWQLDSSQSGDRPTTHSPMPIATLSWSGVLGASGAGG